MSRAQELTDAHWNNYVGPLLTAAGVEEKVIALCAFMYKSSGIHFYKHCQEDAAEAARGALANDAAHKASLCDSEKGGGFDLVAHLHRQMAFSNNTFGPGRRTAGVLDHIRKELTEIEADPHDLMEWVDVILLSLDGAWRAGYGPEDIAAAIETKQTRNEGRKWPDWRTAAPDKAIEHDRSGEVATV